MKHTWKIAVAAAVLAGSAGAAKADLTLNGSTGLFFNPTAQIVEKDAPEVGAHYIDGDLGIEGAIQLVDKLEVSGGLAVGDSDGNGWNLGAKYQLFDGSEKGFSLAVGADYFQAGSGDGHASDIYLAGTKAFNISDSRPPLQGTLGIRYNNYSNSGSSKVDIFAGVDVPLTQEFSVIGEVGTQRFDGGDTQYALGLRYHPQGSAFYVGGGFARDTSFIQAGYHFGS